MGYREFCNRWDRLSREYGNAATERMYDEDPTWGGFGRVDDDDEYCAPRRGADRRPRRRPRRMGIGFVAKYCPVCDGESRVVDVSTGVVTFWCQKCNKTWFRPANTVGFDTSDGVAYPDVVRTVAGAYYKAQKKALKRRTTRKRRC